MAKKQKHPNYQENPPAAPRRQIPGVEARMEGTSLAMDAPRVDMGSPEVVDRVNSVTGSRYQFAEGGQGRMIFPSTTAGEKARASFKGR